MSEHGFEVRKGTYGFVALVFVFEAVLENLLGLELVKVGALHGMDSHSFLHHPFKPLFSRIGASTSVWGNLVLFLRFVFD